MEKKKYRKIGVRRERGELEEGRGKKEKGERKKEKERGRKKKPSWKNGYSPKDVCDISPIPLVHFGNI